MEGKKSLLMIGIIIILIGGLVCALNYRAMHKVHTIGGVVKTLEEEYFVLESDDAEYKFYYLDNEELKENLNVKITYEGKLKKDKVKEVENIEIIKSTMSIEDQIGKNGIFSEYYSKAYELLQNMNLDEKVGQILLVRVPEENKISAISNYHFGGLIMYKRDFEGRTKSEVNKEVSSFQTSSKIPLLIATDEEGGKVVRASSNKQLIDEPFLSSQELYKLGGFDKISEDVIKKSRFLSSLGVNVNLAPVVDVTENPDNYMYERSFGKNTSLSSDYAKVVIETSKKDRSVSYTLKHFPGYGDNADTHFGSNEDKRTYEDIVKNDLPPFEAGIKAGAEAVLVSHNIVSSVDKNNPASLSKDVHNLLRNDLNFDGIIMTDDMDMGAITEIGTQSVYLNALKAGNDLIIVTDYERAFNEIKNGIENDKNLEDTLDVAVTRVLAWKYYKYLFPEK